MEASPMELILQFVPLLIFSLIYAVIVFIVARKRRINPWGWTIGTMIPLFGLIISGVFFVTTLLSILDRLNALESGRPKP